MAKKQRRKQGSRAKDESEGVVVYIHGVGRHLAKEALKLEWDLALFGSDRGTATRMAYWSDIVHPPAASRRAKRTGGVDTSTGILRPEDILEAAGISVRHTGAHEFVLRMLAAHGQAEVVAGTRKRVIPLPPFMREPISRAFLKQFIADTAAYFFNEDKRKRIRQRLMAELPGGATPVTIVAHSQGSIVAIEVLSAVTNVDVLKLVTIGSPLGLQEVQDYLEVPPRKKPFWVPRVVERWHNFADPLDPVALDKRLAGEFVAHPVSQDGMVLAASPIIDEIIVNERTFRLRGFNPHSAVGYLSHPAVRRSVYESIHFDPLARFVVARDVAEALAVEQRHPVLIEVLEPGYSALDETPEARQRREEQERKHGLLTLADRIERASNDVRAVVRNVARDDGASAKEAARAVEQARIDMLRRFVAAHLTPAEIRRIAHEHTQLNVYAVWRSAAKRKLLHRSRAVLQADAALESYRAGGRGITWAVLDTGIRSDHPHFKDRIAAIWDCTRTGPPVRRAADQDRDGHGSHVAGIVAGVSENDGQTISGVAPDASLVIYKVLDDRGEGEDAWIIKALDHIAAQNENNAALAIHGLNLSLGGPYDSTVYGCGFTPICQELRRLWRSGVLVVVACGNEGQLEVQTRGGGVEINMPMSIGDPANLEDGIAVGSVNADRPHLYGISAFSSRGPTSDGRSKPDVVAPGERIASVNARFVGSQRLHRVESGTSMAAPHVSGLLAAFISVRREFIGRPDEVKKVLLDTCTDIGRERHHQGRGIPNLMKMLLSV
jgi:subtilisin family serine protease